MKINKLFLCVAVMTAAISYNVNSTDVMVGGTAVQAGLDPVIQEASSYQQSVERWLTENASAIANLDQGSMVVTIVNEIKRLNGALASFIASGDTQQTSKIRRELSQKFQEAIELAKTSKDSLTSLSTLSVEPGSVGQTSPIAPEKTQAELQQKLDRIKEENLKKELQIEQEKADKLKLEALSVQEQKETAAQEVVVEQKKQEDLKNEAAAVVKTPEQIAAEAQKVEPITTSVAAAPTA